MHGARPCGRRRCHRPARPASAEVLVAVARHDHVVGAERSAASAWCGWRASTVTSLAGTRWRSAASAVRPMMPAPTIEHRLAVDRRPAQQAVHGDRQRLGEHGGVQRRRRPGRACSCETWASSCSPHAPPRPTVKPEAEAGRERLAAEAVARRVGADGAHRARFEAPGGAGQRGVDGHLGPDGQRALGPGLHDRAATPRGPSPSGAPTNGPKIRVSAAVGEDVVEVAAADARQLHRRPAPTPGPAAAARRARPARPGTRDRPCRRRRCARRAA